MQPAAGRYRPGRIRWYTTRPGGAVSTVHPGSRRPRLGPLSTTTNRTPAAREHAGQRPGGPAEGGVQPAGGRIVRLERDRANLAPVIPDHRPGQQPRPGIKQGAAAVPGRVAVGRPGQQQDTAPGRARVDQAGGGQPARRVPDGAQPSGGPPGQPGQQQHRREQDRHGDAQPWPGGRAPPGRRRWRGSGRWPGSRRGPGGGTGLRAGAARLGAVGPGPAGQRTGGRHPGRQQAGPEGLGQG